MYPVCFIFILIKSVFYINLSLFKILKVENKKYKFGKTRLIKSN